MGSASLHRSAVVCSGASRTVRLVTFSFLLLFSTFLFAQDSPGHFELGGNFTSLRFNQAGQFGPGVDGVFNFNRYLALDGSFSWLPTNTYAHVRTGFFGAKAGYRTEHFGFFGKVRPGFLSVGNRVRNETFAVISGPGSLPVLINFSERIDRQTQKALDVGAVMEYYPAHHWSLRWDFGDTLLFREKGPTITIINNGIVSTFPSPTRDTKHNFQFSTGVHYRF